MKRPTLIIASTLLGLIVGCDNNPNGPTFPTVPEGTKLPPANIAPTEAKPPANKSTSKDVAPLAG